MTIEEFYPRVKEELKNYLPKQYQDAAVHIEKLAIDGKARYGVALLQGEKKQIPLLDLQSYCDVVNAGKSVEAVLKELADDYCSLCRPQKENTKVISMTKEDVLSHLHIAVVNFENEKEPLSHLPYLKVNDLAVVPMLSLQNEGSIPVDPEIAELMGVSEDTLVAIALRNHTAVLPPTLQTMLDAAERRDNYIELDSQEPMDTRTLYVLSNERKEYGAAAIADKSFLDKLSRKLGGSFYILPISMHSVMSAQQAKEIDPRFLKSLLENAVKAVSDKGKYLSNNIYLYNAGVRTLEMFDGEHHAEKVQSRTNRKER